MLGIAPLRRWKSCLKNDLRLDILFRKGIRVIYDPWIYKCWGEKKNTQQKQYGLESVSDLEFSL